MRWVSSSQLLYFFLLPLFLLLTMHLVVEKTSALLDKCDAELLGRLEDGLVVLATTGRGNELGP